MDQISSPNRFFCKKSDFRSLLLFPFEFWIKNSFFDNWELWDGKFFWKLHNHLKTIYSGCDLIYSKIRRLRAPVDSIFYFDFLLFYFEFMHIWDYLASFLFFVSPFQPGCCINVPIQDNQFWEKSTGGKCVNFSILTRFSILATYYLIFSLPRNWVAMMTLRSRDFHPRRATMVRSSVSDEFCVPIDCQQLWEKSVTGFWPTDSIFAAPPIIFLRILELKFFFR